MKHCIVVVLVLGFFACSGHPTINPVPLKKGESSQFITFSSESIVPVFTYRKGVTKFTSIGTHIGLPLYGSGFDISRILKQSKSKYSLVNLSWNYSMNPSFDFTLYSFKKNQRRKNIITYVGYRGMLIPKGLANGSSLRFGILLGYYKNNSWGYELGYLHDFNRLDSEDLIVHDSNISDEKDPLTGILFRIFLPFFKM